jgi:hypothetical protein
MTKSIQYGPFNNEDPESNVPAYKPVDRPRPSVDHEVIRAEMVAYFTARHQRLRVEKTTHTPRGQILDWIPIESQHPRGDIASPPPRSELKIPEMHREPERAASSELERADCERGPAGTVPVLRKKLEALGYTRPLRQYLSKTFGQPVLNFRGTGFIVPGPEGRGTHRLAKSSQNLICFGGEGLFSCFDPYVDNSDEHSLIQIALTNHDLSAIQTVEAGWQEYPDILGDWVPHLFVYYTTNGYARDDDGQGGYNLDVDGWVQHDNVIFPGTTFTPYSRIGGEQRMISIKYQLWRDNWWVSCQGRWVGYYPARLFMGNQSVFSTLGDHADHIAFWGEVASFDASPSKTDMGSGRFGHEGWTRAAYMHNLRVQTGREAGMADYDGTLGLHSTDPSLYDIDAHFFSGTQWGSFQYVGGPGAG